MASTRTQQIGIWIIAVVLTVGTIGSFVAIVLANDNQNNQKANQQADYEEQLAAYEKQAAEAAKAGAENSEPLDGYSATPFDANVSELKVEVLKEGTGEAISPANTINASYFGWLSDGTIFDSSNKKDAEDAPVSFPLNQVIQGWTQGLSDQKVGSVVKLTIPAADGYGANGSGIIPANAPLQFIVIIHKIDTTES